MEYAVRHNPLKALAAAAKPLLTGLAKVVSTVASVPAKVVDTVRDVVTDAAKSAEALYEEAVEAVGTVVENVSKAADAVSEFAQEHSSAIGGIVAGAVVGIGCGVAIGWTGVGAVACGALAGAVGSFVTGYLEGERGWDLAGTTALGGIFGGITGGLGSVAGAAIGSGIRALGGGLGVVGRAAVGGARGEVSNIASGRIGGLVGRAGKCNSFVPGTAVLMADGSAKPIEDVQVGDLVLATDPTTGETATRPVTDLIVGDGEKQLVEITIDIDGDRGDRIGTLVATENHPLWVPSLDEWVTAGELRAGSLLRTAAGTYVQVTAIAQRTAADQPVHNLTIDGIHTYYVVAGTASVLVHNCGEFIAGPNLGSLRVSAANPSASEVAAAQHMAARGGSVVLRDPVGARSGGMTSDLLVDGVAWDVYSPTSRSINHILTNIAKKHSQVNGGGVVVDLSGTGLPAGRFGNALRRVNGMIGSWGKQPISGLEFIGG